jgi:hypothetical protein
MYVVFTEELEEVAYSKGHIVPTLEQAFAQSFAAAAMPTISNRSGTAGRWSLRMWRRRIAALILS